MTQPHVKLDCPTCGNFSAGLSLVYQYEFVQHGIRELVGTAWVLDCSHTIQDSYMGESLADWESDEEFERDGVMIAQRRVLKDGEVVLAFADSYTMDQVGEDSYDEDSSD